MIIYCDILRTNTYQDAEFVVSVTKLQSIQPNSPAEQNLEHRCNGSRISLTSVASAVTATVYVLCTCVDYCAPMARARARTLTVHIGSARITTTWMAGNGVLLFRFGVLYIKFFHG